MNILFLHRGFPAQFKYLVKEFTKDPFNMVMFITNNQNVKIDGVIKLVYQVQQGYNENCHPYLQIYEEAIRHGQASAAILLQLKQKGIKPDVIYGFSWGPSMFVKDIFPDVPYICYFEWFVRTHDSVYDFGGRILDENRKAELKCNNSHVLMDLYNSDGGISPTLWQKSQFPKEYQDKIKLLHDGVDTDIHKPNIEAELKISDELTLTANDEVITYATRGMEPYRGFPEFMEAVAILQKKRPNAHFVIAGDNINYYSPRLSEGSYKEIMLQKLNLDMRNIHFVGTLPYEEYVKLLQISSVHIYLTYPLILSWSILDAMATGCCIVASNTKPVLEVIKDNENGLLVDFPNVEKLVERIEYALELRINNPDEMQRIKANARQTIVDNYALKDLLPRHIEFIKSFIHK